MVVKKSRAATEPEPTTPSVPGLTDETVLATNEADAFGAAYQEIAAKSEESLAALKRKRASPIRRVLYRDLESTIWTLWHVRPDDLTVNHIGWALHLLQRTSGGGVELDPLSCEACGIDHATLMPLIRRSLGDADDMSAGPKVPRQSTSGTKGEPVASEVAQLPVERSDPDRENGAATALELPDDAKKKAALSVKASDTKQCSAESAGQQINRYREECRMTVEALAEAIDVGVRTVQRHIADDYFPYARLLGGYERVFSELLKRKIVIKKMP